MSKFMCNDEVAVMFNNKKLLGTIIGHDTNINMFFVELENGASSWYTSNNLELVSDHKNLTTLPTDSSERKTYPLFRGCLRYFPAALAGIARISKLGNDKHNPGEEMYHARGKSVDHGDCILRHLMDVEDLVSALENNNTSVTKEEVLNEVNQMAWRALAFSQTLHEKFGSPLAPGAKNASK